MPDPTPQISPPTVSTATGFVWPVPDQPGHPPATPLTGEPTCRVEGLNGHTLEGGLALFEPRRGVLQLRISAQGRPMQLRMEQFRRLHLLEPATAPKTGTAAKSATPAPPAGQDRPLMLTFEIEFKGAPLWRGHTLGHHEETWGLFLFEPLEEGHAVRRWFVPRVAYTRAEIGLRVGEAMLEPDTATPEQIRVAMTEQESLRGRSVGEMLVVRQITTAEELAAAIDLQSRMPMVRIGEALTALDFITEAQLEEALALQRSDRSVPLGELLVRQGLISRTDLQTALARKMGYPLVDVQQFPPDADAVTRVPYALAARLTALPLMMLGGRLVMAVEDPSNRGLTDELEFAAQCKVLMVLSRAGVLQAAIDRVYEKVGAAERSGRGLDPRGTIDSEPGDAKGLLATLERADSPAEDTEDAGIPQSDNSLVRLINSMILEAHRQGVSDIHVECPGGREKTRIRFRTDGQLRPYLELPHTYRSALIARLKIMCDLDISERRKPQDGKINFARFVPGARLELRVATIPTINSMEDAVLRLLVSNKPMPLAELGLSPDNLQRLQATAARPYGLLLCAGPTGSGKTTTLHSLLASINTANRKIWTAEDPVEITQAGLRQVQVNPRIDWTFAKALRAFLRADPDVIMVGEIRDQETAQVAIEASLTGHLVLSTLHTNSAAETVTRLLDMGMDPFNFADSLQGVLAQRLVRRLCPRCRTARDATDEEVQELLGDYLHTLTGVDGAPDRDALHAQWLQRFGVDGRLKHFSSPGCEHCQQQGYRGRAGIHELMTVSHTMRHLIQTGTRSDDLQREALREGLRTLRQDGIEKVLAGVTSIEEIRANS